VLLGNAVNLAEVAAISAVSPDPIGDCAVVRGPTMDVNSPEFMTAELQVLLRSTMIQVKNGDGTMLRFGAIASVYPQIVTKAASTWLGNKSFAI
jgi:hypothetical protein